ncbi:MAG: AAA family ATPase, partial [Planctomycetota bacterium]
MKLVSIEIHHFRCISHLYFQWDGAPFICLEGATNTGKSSLCQAILFAFLGTVPSIESTLQLIHWSASEAMVQLRFHYQSKVYRISRLLTREGNAQFRLWNETETQELFS